MSDFHIACKFEPSAACYTVKEVKSILPLGLIIVHESGVVLTSLGLTITLEHHLQQTIAHENKILVPCKINIIYN